MSINIIAHEQDLHCCLCSTPPPQVSASPNIESTAGGLWNYLFSGRLKYRDGETIISTWKQEKRGGEVLTLKSVSVRSLQHGYRWVLPMMDSHTWPDRMCCSTGCPLAVKIIRQGIVIGS